MRDECMHETAIGLLIRLLKERRWAGPGSPAGLLLRMIAVWLCSKTCLGGKKSSLLQSK